MKGWDYWHDIAPVGSVKIQFGSIDLCARSTLVTHGWVRGLEEIHNCLEEMNRRLSVVISVFFYDRLTLVGCFYSCDVRNNVDWLASSEQDHVACKTSTQSFVDKFEMHSVFEQLPSLDQEVLTLYTFKFNANRRRANNMRKLASATFESCLRS